ncbi:MAG: hypothetical protein IIY70_01620 [Oscillospiraceae bacterium]|nr:hypothetical protein [Oscillospiraceae bacterium]
MTEEKDTIVVSLSDFWAVFTRHIFWILLVGLLAGAAVYGCGIYEQNKKPVYKSTATLYILKQETGNYDYTQSDFNLAMNVVNDCVYFLKNNAILDQVIKDLNMKDQYSYSNLRSAISTNNPTGTRVLEVSVRASKADDAKKIVDTLCRVASEKISSTMGLNQIKIHSWGTLPTVPSNTVSIKRVVFAGLCASFAMYLLFLILFLSDDKVRTEEDVQHYLNLTVLGVIPNVQEVESKKFKKKKRYDSYGAYKAYGVYGSYGAKNGPQNGVNSGSGASAEDKKQDGGGRHE